MKPVDDEHLTFRVSVEFRRLFKSTAALHGIPMKELLVEAFDLWMQEKGLKAKPKKEKSR